MKIIDFIKENWIGALVGGVYGLVSGILLVLGISTYSILLSLPVIPILAAAFGVLGLAPGYLMVFAVVLVDVFAFILIGTFVQRTIVKKKFSLYPVLGIILYLIGTFLVIFYFISLSPSHHPLSRCTLQSGIPCLDYQVTSEKVIIVIQNALGYDISIDSVSAKNCEKLTYPGFLGSREMITLSFSCLNEGNKYQGEINITYTNLSTGKYAINKGYLDTPVYCLLGPELICKDPKVTRKKLAITILNYGSYNNVSLDSVSADNCEELTNQGIIGSRTSTREKTINLKCSNEGEQYDGEFTLSYTNSKTRESFTNKTRLIEPIK
jgi:hypothetical protein